MHVIDSHAHVDEYEAFGWFDPPETLIELMDEAGIHVPCLPGRPPSE